MKTPPIDPSTGADTPANATVPRQVLGGREVAQGVPRSPIVQSSGDDRGGSSQVPLADRHVSHSVNPPVAGHVNKPDDYGYMTARRQQIARLHACSETPLGQPFPDWAQPRSTHPHAGPIGHGIKQEGSEDMSPPQQSESRKRKRKSTPAVEGSHSVNPPDDYDLKTRKQRDGMRTRVRNKAKLTGQPCPGWAQLQNPNPRPIGEGIEPEGYDDMTLQKQSDCRKKERKATPAGRTVAKWAKRMRKAPSHKLDSWSAGVGKKPKGYDDKTQLQQCGYRTRERNATPEGVEVVYWAIKRQPGPSSGSTIHGPHASSLGCQSGLELDGDIPDIPQGSNINAPVIEGNVVHQGEASSGQASNANPVNPSSSGVPATDLDPESSGAPASVTDIDPDRVDAFLNSLEPAGEGEGIDPDVLDESEASYGQESNANPVDPASSGAQASVIEGNVFDESEASSGQANSGQASNANPVDPASSGVPASVTGLDPASWSRLDGVIPDIPQGSNINAPVIDGNVFDESEVSSGQANSAQASSANPVDPASSVDPASDADVDAGDAFLSSLDVAIEGEDIGALIEEYMNAPR